MVAWDPMRQSVRAVVKYAISAVFLGIQTVTLAQPGAITQAPAQIPFEPWRETTSSEFVVRYEISFPSAVTSPYAINNTVTSKVYLPTERVGPVPCVILLHFWGATDSNVEIAMAEQLARRGIASVIMPLPYHLSRTPEGTRSGELTIVPDANKLRETMIQSVRDVRRTVDWIQSKSEFRSDAIGITGTSLGAIVTSMVFAVEPRIRTASFMLGGVDLAHILWNSSRVVALREVLRREGYTEDRLRRELAEIEPLNYLKPDDRKSYVIKAKFDTVIPPASADRLINALGTPEVLQIDTGHYGGALVQSRLIRSVVRFFDANFAGSSFSAPEKFYSPTIRFGLTFNPDRGLQVAAGMDVWRLSKQSEAFASVLVTPRGLEGFLGIQVSRGISLGLSVNPRKTTIGGFWSIVF